MKPTLTRMPVKMSGRHEGKMTWRKTCQRLAPSDWAPWMRSWPTPRTPAMAATDSGGNAAR